MTLVDASNCEAINEAITVGNVFEEYLDDEFLNVVANDYPFAFLDEYQSTAGGFAQIYDSVVDFSNVRMTNCRVAEEFGLNLAFGGGLFMAGWNAFHMTESSIVHSTVESVFGAGYTFGGGLFCYHISEPVDVDMRITLSSCVIKNCSTSAALDSSGGGVGLAVAGLHRSKIIIVECIISDCRATLNEGAAAYSDEELVDHAAHGGGVWALGVEYTQNSFSLAIDISATLVERCSADDSRDELCRAFNGTNCYAQGGGIMINSGTLSLGHGAAIRDCRATIGASLFPGAGINTYIFPTPPGYWLPTSLCKVYRAACPLAIADEEQSQACLRTREQCSVTADEWVNGSFVTAVVDGTECQAAGFVQPCDWNLTSAWLGTQIYQLPQEPVDADLPNPCAAGILGGTAADQMGSAYCAGLCPPGQLCPTPATVTPQPCPPGSFCPEGSSVPLACAAGSYSGAVNISSQAQCAQCPEGSYCSTGSTEPTQCAPGTYAANTGLDVCESCAAGTFQSERGKGFCEPCPNGYYCYAGASVPLPCPAGTYRGYPNGSSVDDCAECPIGHYCHSESTAPTPCPAGRYGDQPGQQRSECSGPCAAGHFCREGSVTPTDSSCPPGTDNPTPGGASTSSCLPCGAGTYAPANGTENCLTCDPGTFQGAVGQTSCDVCSVGSYCPRGATQPLLCEAGRFGDSAGLTNSTCTGPCSPGYYCEAGSQEPTRGACPPGSANPFYGAQSAESCVPCPVGQAANTSASTACTPCSAGTYAPSQGRRQCLPCPRQTAATEGSAQCDLCAEGYYKLDEDATTENSCKACPEGAICSIGTKLSTLVLKAGYWRLTPRALILTKCEDPNGVERCRGGESKVVEGNGYCAPFLHGPECKGCSEGSYYDAAQGRCRDCKIAWTLMACLTTVLLIFVAILAAATKLINPNTKLHPRRKMLKKLQRNLRSLALALSSVGAMAKLKILLAFLQISQAFSTVYAVHFPSTLTSWTWILGIFRMQYWFFPPFHCTNLSYENYILTQAMLPLAVVALVMAVCVALSLSRAFEVSSRMRVWANDFRNLLVDHRQGHRKGEKDVGKRTGRDTKSSANSKAISSGDQGCRISNAARMSIAACDPPADPPSIRAKAAVTTGLLVALPFALYITFFFAAPICCDIFRSWLCESYQVDVTELSQRAFLRANLDVVCSDSQNDSKEHDSITRVSLWLIFVWPVGMLILYAGLLCACKNNIIGRVRSQLSDATIFLHRDYHDYAFWWETFELLRRTTLVGWVLLIPHEKQFIRLITGLLVSQICLTVLLLVRPYKMHSDFQLASLSQVCMIFLFVCAIIISQWGTVADYANSEVAESVLGIDSDDEVAIIMLALTASVVSTLLALFAFQTYLVKRARQIEDKYSTCTMNPPIFAWRLESSYAAFLSHYKAECAADARFLHDSLRKMLRCPIYLDSSTLSDLRWALGDR
uniref:Tyrosine-protein kinase ephrin type A/B receptor-like domain-containing protein n=1 Tax=Chrysotila carterae TaxID=13221 RepID=A0A6T0BY87_CHRCT